MFASRRAPCTSATATPRFATPGTSSSARWRRCRRRCARCCAGSSPGCAAGICAASRGVDAYIANSQLTRERIKRFYGRESTVIHPPVETQRFTPGEPGDALLLVAELVAHKRVDVALEAARRAGVPIQVVGAGPDDASAARGLSRGRVPRPRRRRRSSPSSTPRARAVVVPSIEEFGITAVEAQAAGRPVIAAGAGGALETVLDGETGLFAEPGDVDAFAAAIEALDRLDFEPARAVANAERFSVASFQRRLSRFVAETVAAPARGRRAPRALSGLASPG